MLVLLFCCDFRLLFVFIFFFKQKTAYELRISDWSSDVCSSDLCVSMHMARLAVRAMGECVHPSGCLSRNAARIAGPGAGIARPDSPAAGVSGHRTRDRGSAGSAGVPLSPAPDCDRTTQRARRVMGARAE